MGSRTVVAIRIDGVHVVKFDAETGTKEKYFETEDEKWYEGPPYGVVEYVLDENEIDNCTFEPEEVIFRSKKDSP